MSVELLAAAAFFGAAIFWNVATVAVLRTIGIAIPCSLPFRLFRRRTPEVLDALCDRRFSLARAFATGGGDFSPSSSRGNSR